MKEDKMTIEFDENGKIKVPESQNDNDDEELEGGDTTINNGQIVHRYCNLRKG